MQHEICQDSRSYGPSTFAYDRALWFTCFGAFRVHRGRHYRVKIRDGQDSGLANWLDFLSGCSKSRGYGKGSGPDVFFVYTVSSLHFPRRPHRVAGMVTGS